MKCLNFSVQLFTIPSMTPAVVRSHGLLSNLLSALTATFAPFKPTPRKDKGRWEKGGKKREGRKERGRKLAR